MGIQWQIHKFYNKNILIEAKIDFNLSKLSKRMDKILFQRYKTVLADNKNTLRFNKQIKIIPTFQQSSI